MDRHVRRTRENIPEVALRLLRERRQTMHYKDLVQEIIRERGEGEVTPELMAHVLTQINLDSRFVHMGKGIWGLRDWAPATLKSTPVVIPGDYQPKHDDYIFDEEDEADVDDESELLVPVVDDEDEELFEDEEGEVLDEDLDELDEDDEDEPSNRSW